VGISEKLLLLKPCNICIFTVYLHEFKHIDTSDSKTPKFEIVHNLNEQISMPTPRIVIGNSEGEGSLNC